MARDAGPVKVRGRATLFAIPRPGRSRPTQRRCHRSRRNRCSRKPQTLREFDEDPVAEGTPARRELSRNGEQQMTTVATWRRRAMKPHATGVSCRCLRSRRPCSEQEHRRPSGIPVGLPCVRRSTARRRHHGEPAVTKSQPAPGSTKLCASRPNGEQKRVCTTACITKKPNTDRTDEHG
jgi:hypothetical protein